MKMDDNDVIVSKIVTVAINGGILRYNSVTL